MDAPKSKKLATAPSGLAKAQREKVVHCWAYGKPDHTKGDPNYSKKKGGGAGKAKPKTKTAKSEEKVGGKGKKLVTCFHCSKSSHSDENCFVFHLKKHSTSSGAKLKVVKTFQVKIAKLKKQMSTMASLEQLADIGALM